MAVGIAAELSPRQHGDRPGQALFLDNSGEGGTETRILSIGEYIYRISVQVLALSPHLSEQLLRECVHFEFSPSGVGCLVLLGYKLIWQEAPGFLEFS